MEPIWFSKDEVSKEFEECQYKIVVSVGSIKTGILGEIFLNLANFLNLVDPTAISLPLKRCNSGTVLQFLESLISNKLLLQVNTHVLSKSVFFHGDRNIVVLNIKFIVQMSLCLFVSQTVHDIRGHLDFSFASAWNSDGRTFTTGNQDKTCRVWDIRKQELDFFGEIAGIISFSPDTEALFVGVHDCT